MSGHSIRRVTSPRPILYSFRRCPYAMRARMALLISDNACEIREVVLRDKPAAMLAASPKATVPVLVLPDGTVIDESIDIMHWALARHDPEAWLRSADDPAIVACDGAFKHHLDRYKYPDRHAADPIEHRNAAVDILTRWEARLRAADNLCGDARSLADVAVFPFVRQYAAVDPEFFDSLPLPQLRCWLDRHIASPLFEQAMVRLKPWEPTALCVMLAIDPMQVEAQ